MFAIIKAICKKPYVFKRADARMTHLSSIINEFISPH